jgi:hypothetical protein
MLTWALTTKSAARGSSGGIGRAPLAAYAAPWLARRQSQIVLHPLLHVQQSPAKPRRLVAVADTQATRSARLWFERPGDRSLERVVLKSEPVCETEAE